MTDFAEALKSFNLDEAHGAQLNPYEIMEPHLAEMIGEGAHRRVYTLKDWPDYVVKIEKHASVATTNIIEMQTWLEAPAEHDKWLAPARAYAAFGFLLFQDRTTPVKDISEMPERIPNWLTDTKIQNWGWLKDRVVCHDYGMNLAMIKGMTRRMYRPKWWVAAEGVPT
jgi:hypothetical protein